MVPAARFPDLLEALTNEQALTDRLWNLLRSQTRMSDEQIAVHLGVPVHPRPRESRTPRQPAQVPVSRPEQGRVHPDPPWDMFARLRATSATEEDA